MNASKPSKTAIKHNHPDFDIDVLGSMFKYAEHVAGIQGEGEGQRPQKSGQRMTEL